MWCQTTPLAVTVVLQVRIDKFSIEVDPQQLPGGTHYYLVKGEAVERFAQVWSTTLCVVPNITAIFPKICISPTSAVPLRSVGAAWVFPSSVIHAVMLTGMLTE